MESRGFVTAVPGWLEPMLARIADNKTNVICPVIDQISDETFHLSYARDISVGGFDWNLQFSWHGVPAREKVRLKNAASPIR